MPQAIPILAAIAVKSAPAWVQGLVVAAASVVSGLLSAEMAKTGRTSAQDLENRQRIVRSSTQPRRVIYGEAMVSGPLAFAESTGDENQYAHIVIPLAGHEVEEIGDIYLDDELLDENSDKYNYVRIKKHLGTAAQTADSDLVSEVPQWTENHTLSGIAYIYVRLEWARVIWPTGLPQIKAVVKGKKVFDPRDDSISYSNNWALCVRDYLTSSYGLEATDAEIDDDMLVTAANICDEDLEPGDLIDLDDVLHDWQFSGTADGFTGQTATVLTTSEYLSLTASAANPILTSPLFTAFDVDENPYLRIRLRRVAGSTWEGHMNVRDYLGVWGSLTSSVIDEIPADGEFHFVEVDLSEHWAGMSLTRLSFHFTQDSDSQTDIDYIQIGNRAAFPRYTANGTIELDSDPASIIDDMMTAAGGALVYSQGKYKLSAAAYSSPVGTLNEDDLRGEIGLRPRPPRAELANSIRGQFVSPEDSWQPVDFPPVTNSLYVTQDGGDEIWREITLPFTTDAVRAQILAKMLLERSRQALLVEFPAKYSGMLYTPGDIIQLSVDSFGWTDKEFRVVGWKVAQDGGGVDLTLQEEASTSYDWNNGEATRYDPSPDTNLPNPSICDPPTGITIESGDNHLGVANDGTVYARMYVTWTPPTSGFVMRYEVEHKKAADTVWASGTSLDANVYLGPVTDGVLYDVRVRTVNSLGVVSAWAYYSNYYVDGKTAVPPAVSEFTVARQSDGTREFSVSYPNKPADHAGYRIYAKLGTGQTLPNMDLLNTSGLITAFPFESNQLAAGSYTFACTAVDTSGLESLPLYIETTLADPRLGNVAYSEYPESSGWLGTKTDCAVGPSGYLNAISDAEWGDFATWADMSAWADGSRSPIVYEHTEIDLGFDVVFTPLITAICDGTPVIEVQWKPDGGSYSTWGAAASVTARYLKVKVTVTGDAPRIKSLPIILSAETITEEINDLDTSTLTGSHRIAVGDIRLPITKPYTVISQVQHALQSVSGGWSIVVVDKDTTVGPRIQVYNSSGTLADATIDAFIRGL